MGPRKPHARQRPGVWAPKSHSLMDTSSPIPGWVPGESSISLPSLQLIWDGHVLCISDLTIFKLRDVPTKVRWSPLSQ